MTNQKYPKVTIVAANPLRKDIANGILMRSLFAGWQKDRLSQIYFPVGTEYPPEFDICGEYRRIGTTGLVRRYRQDDAVSASSSSQKKDKRASPNPPMALNQKALQACKQHQGLHRWLKLAQETWYAHSWIGKALEQQLRELQPDIVYAMFGNYCLTKITYLACKRLNIPMLLHVTDDYVTSLYHDFPFAGHFKASSDRWFRRAVSYADGLAAISPAMAKEFGRRYDKQWSWYTTLVDIDAYDPKPRPEDGMTRLVFAGNLGIGRWRCLRELALALDQLRKEKGINTQLDIYSSTDQINTHRKALDIPNTTKLRGWVSPERLPAIFQSADILVHAESFDPKVTDLTKYSFSTKLGQYMTAGRCILAFGPRDVASIQLIETTGGGFTICDTDSGLIKTELEKMLRDKSKQYESGQKGRQWALQWVHPTLGRERFRENIVQALGRSQSARHVQQNEVYAA